MHASEKKERSTITRTSCRSCHGVCQVLVHQDASGNIIRITGDKESPTSQGFICPKGASAAELLYHPQRLTRPLRRVGKRGQGAWEAISWDAATDMIAGRFTDIIQESGPESIAIAQGTGRPYTEFTGRFCHALGSPNHVSPGFNCFVPRGILRRDHHRLVPPTGYLRKRRRVARMHAGLRQQRHGERRRGRLLRRYGTQGPARRENNHRY